MGTSFSFTETSFRLGVMSAVELLFSVLKRALLHVALFGITMMDTKKEVFSRNILVGILTVPFFSMVAKISALSAFSG